MPVLILSFLFHSYSYTQNCQTSQLFTGSISTVMVNYGNEHIGEVTDFNLKPYFKQPGQVVLKFNLAYAYAPEHFDSLAIMMSVNCGSTWETLFYSGGEELSTTNPTTDYFSPAPDEWQKYEFNLNLYRGLVLIRFRFINGNGNNIYLDDIHFQDILSSSNDAIEIKSNLYPNPVSEIALLELTTTVNEASLIIVNVLGQKVLERNGLNGNQIEIDAIPLQPGIFNYILFEKGNRKSTGQFIVVD